jgi:putative DNA primase/helicase
MAGDDFERIVDAPARPKVRRLRLAGGKRAGTASPPVDPTQLGKANGISAIADDRPSLLVRWGDLPKTALELRDYFAGAGVFFDRGTLPVQLIYPATGELPMAKPMTISSVVIEAHRIVRPQKLTNDGLVDVTLPDRVARLYLEGLVSKWNLMPLKGVCTSPILGPDGGIRIANGYDAASRLWCHGVDGVRVVDHPSEEEALAALHTLREAFRTFPFADSTLLRSEDGLEVVDLDEPPQHDESAFLVGMMTAVCRPSLELAPGLLLYAADTSGAGSGKGLLARAICSVAFGFKPRAFPPGKDRDELDKRLTAELIEAAPAIFIDNVNATVLRLDTLAAALTESPCRVRPLGISRMVEINSSCFVVLTGNGLQLSEDLARRFICCRLDARCEDPESRTFPPGFLEQIAACRAELLGALLTIWRWGRRQDAVGNLMRGKALGSYETWSRWCRDPLLALGCQDPVERIKITKMFDPKRIAIAEPYTSWNDRHGQTPMRAADLCEEVQAMLVPGNRTRQSVVSELTKRVVQIPGDVARQCGMIAPPVPG